MGLSSVLGREQEQTQIPCGNDRQKSKDKSKRRFPAGWQTRARQKQVPCGNDRKKSKDKSKRRFPAGMTTRVVPSLPSASRRCSLQADACLHKQGLSAAALGASVVFAVLRVVGGELEGRFSLARRGGWMCKGRYDGFGQGLHCGFGRFGVWWEAEFAEGGAGNGADGDAECVWRESNARSLAEGEEVAGG